MQLISNGSPRNFPYRRMQAFANLPIRTARLVLRPLRQADVAALFEIHANPKEGLFRERCIVDGEISDAAMYGLLRREWNQAP